MSDKITLRDAFGQPFEVPAEEGPGGTLIPLQKVQLSGSTISIGGKDYRLLNGNELHALAADKPTAADAAAAVGLGVLYVAVDTGIVERSDGTTWQPV